MHPDLMVLNWLGKEILGNITERQKWSEVISGWCVSCRRVPDAIFLILKFYTVATGPQSEWLGSN